jgi:ribosomal-protein-alanine N-acetyltransferase
MIIRSYNKSDDANIIELLRLNTPQYFAPAEEADLIDYLADHTHNYFVIEIDKTIVGCGGINITNGGEVARISWDIIHPEQHGKGFGAALTKHRLQKIKEIPGIKTVWVRTTQLAYLFYQKQGFDLKRIEENYWANGFHLYQMECDINSISTE